MGVNENPTVDAANPPAPEVDLAGRKDVNDLAQAYRASGQEAMRQKERADQLEQQLRSVQRPDIPQRNNDPYSELEGIGVPTNHLRAAIQQEAAQFFAPVVQQIQGQAQARNNMLASYGNDYVQYEQDVAQHIQANPELQAQYNAIFQSDPVRGPTAAAKYAFLDYGETKRRSAPTPPDTKAEQAKAQVPTSNNAGGSGSRAHRGGDDQQDRVNRAWEAYQKNPNRHTAEAYAKSRFRTVISDEFLNQ